MSAAVGIEQRFERERAELQRILSSDSFRRSKSHKLILEYVCQAYFDGTVEDLKEYSIAVDALGRPDNFDHRKDSIVRVEFHKLRKRLAKYYSGTQEAHDFRIEIPPGQYAPSFVPYETANHPAAHPGEPTAEKGPPLNKGKRIAIAVLAAAAALTLAFFLGSRYESRTSAAFTPSAAELMYRVSIGSSDSPYVDDLGLRWGGDGLNAVGGEAVTDDSILLEGSPSPTVYRTRREGTFSYSLPLPPGQYELRLFFVESLFGPGNPGNGEAAHGEGSRVFHVEANGSRILDEFDILAAAGGPNRPVEKVFAGLSPGADGILRLDFLPQAGAPILNGLEVFKTPNGKMRPLRVLAGRFAPLMDQHGQEWGPDQYVYGGRPVPRQNIVTGADTQNLFAGERYGNFRYVLPVDPEGVYTVRLLFAETWWGTRSDETNGGEGSRLFDVLCNGVKLLNSFDIYREAGGPNKAIVREFRSQKPNPLGMIELSFIPIENYAAVNAIEIIQE